MFESGFVASQIVIQKLAEVNETRRRKIAPARPAATVLRNVLHPHRELAKVRLVMTGKRSTEKPRIMRDHTKSFFIFYDLGREKFAKNKLANSFRDKQKAPELAPRALVSLKQLAYLEMKSQSSSEDMEIQLSIDGGMRLERSTPGARDKNIGRRTFVPKIHVEISKVQHPMLA